MLPVITIKDASVLTLSQYKMFKHLISTIDKPYWLSSRGETDGYMSIVYDTKDLDVCDSDVFPASRRYVRPALTIETNMDYNAGDVVEIFGLDWTVLKVNNNEMLVMCNQVVAQRPFGRLTYEWEKSALRKWLRNWVECMAQGIERLYVQF